MQLLEWYNRIPWIFFLLLGLIYYWIVMKYKYVTNIWKILIGFIIFDALFLIFSNDYRYMTSGLTILGIVIIWWIYCREEGNCKDLKENLNDETNII